MIKRIRIYPRIAIKEIAKEGWIPPSEAVWFTPPWHLISIYTDPGWEVLTPDAIANLQALGMQEYMSLMFGDIVDTSKFERLKAQSKQESIAHIKPFGAEQADDVLNFLYRINDLPEESTLICHCDAGISRSAAVGQFTYDLFRDSVDSLTNYNHYSMPNSHVLRMLRRAWERTQAVPG